MVVCECKVACWTFIIYLFSSLYFLSDFTLKGDSLVLFKISGVLVISFIAFRFVSHLEVVKRSALLGLVFGCGLFLSFHSHYSNWRSLGWYLAALSFFHFSEYIMTALYNPDKLSIDSFLLNHSFEYKVAAVFSWVEFLVEIYFLPAFKTQFWLICIGLFMVLLGEVLRKVAMVTAKSNFTHLVQFTKRDGHYLVTWGIYGWCRHPGYVGWFWWSIGTQLILCNPICLIGYGVASWKFFKERIWDEELYLLQFFGEEYVNYQESVGTGLPFIHGVVIDKKKH